MRTFILIGMPGSGKTTLGKLLAERTGATFIDTDQRIEARVGQSLEAYKQCNGYQALRDREREILRELHTNLCPDMNSPAGSAFVVSTGGSAVYARKEMEALASLGIVFYLRIRIETLQCRIGSGSDRGLAMPENSDLSALYAEREPLYTAVADHIFDNDQNASERNGTKPGEELELVVDRLISLLH